MKWEKNLQDSITNQKYYLTNGTHNICKVELDGKLTYELWIKGGERLGIFNSFDEAKGKLDEKK